MIETSVILPTFNRLAFLPEAVDSVLQQTYKDFELIIVDDGSTDATADYVAGLTAEVRYVYQQNGGPSAAPSFPPRAAGGSASGVPLTKSLTS